jgi:isomerase DpgB
MTIAQSAVTEIIDPGSPNHSLTLDVTATLSAAMVSAVMDACDQVEDSGQKSRLVVYLQGSSTQYAAVDWPGEHISLPLATSWERALRRLEQLSCPIIGAANGLCNSAALEVLLCCDFRVATANLCIRKELRSRAWPGMLVYRLAKELGIAKARAVLRSEEISAREAVALSLIDTVASDLGEQVAIQATRMRNAPMVSMVRRLLAESFAMTYEDALGIHLAACDKFIRSRREH